MVKGEEFFCISFKIKSCRVRNLQVVVIQQLYRDCIIKNRKGIDRNSPFGIAIVKGVVESEINIVLPCKTDPWKV